MTARAGNGAGYVGFGKALDAKDPSLQSLAELRIKTVRIGGVQGFVALLLSSLFLLRLRLNCWRGGDEEEMRRNKTMEKRDEEEDDDEQINTSSRTCSTNFFFIEQRRNIALLKQTITISRWMASWIRLSQLLPRHRANMG